MFTPPYTSATSPSSTGSKPNVDPDLLEFALKRLEEAEAEGKTDDVAQRLLAAKRTPPSPTSQPLTQPSTPKKRKRESAFPPSAFSSPIRRCFPPPMPPTPGVARKKPGDDTHIFPGEILTTINDPTPIPLTAPFSIKVVYQDVTGRNHNLFKQPEGSKSCWAYSFAMLLSDLVRSGKSLQLDTTFWTWFQNAYLLKAETVQKQASKIDVELELMSIPLEDPLSYIREQIRISGFPVLTSIDHQIFSGHAIVIDSVTDTHTIIRDPYSRKAWKIPNNAMKSYYSPDKEEGLVDEAEQQKMLIYRTF